MIPATHLRLSVTSRFSVTFENYAQGNTQKNYYLFYCASKVAGSVECEHIPLLPSHSTELTHFIKDSSLVHLYIAQFNHREV